MFHYDRFASLIKLARNNGYVFITFGEVHSQASPSTCLLRHDVDNSPEAALRLAVIESELGIRSTYFFMFASETYNCLAPTALRIIRQIREMGHEIGLHFAEAAFDDLADANDIKWEKRLAGHLKRELSLLSHYIGDSVNAFSFHQPSRAIIDIKLALPGFINAYRPQDVGHTVYISDSCMRWKDKEPESLFLENKPQRIQLLLHPMWWREEMGTVKDRWRNVLEERASTVWKGWVRHEDSVLEAWPHPKVISPLKSE